MWAAAVVVKVTAITLGRMSGSKTTSTAKPRRPRSLVFQNRGLFFAAFAPSRWILLSFAGGELAYQIATHLEVNGKLVHREDFTPYFKHLSGMDPRLFLGMLKHASEHTAYDHLPQVKVPTLIVAGTADTFTPYWLSEEMHDRIAGSELLTVPGGTHVSPIEHPELIALRLEKFLSRIPAVSSKPELRSA